MAQFKLPSHLFLEYQRYKHDTGIIAGWLSSTALKVGYKLDPTITDSTERAPKLKGRARKLARDAAKEVASNASAGSKRTIMIADFSAMAKHIIASKPQPQLPYWLQRVFLKTIAARRKCTEWFEKTAKTDSADNQRHAYFANILESVLNILKPCWESPKSHESERNCNKPQPSVPEHPTPAQSSTNLFESLPVEEPEEEPMTQAEQASHEKADKVNEAYIKLDESELEAEFVYAIWSFLQELHGLRNVLRSVWTQCLTGRMEMMEAAILTNTTIDLVRRAEAEFDISLKHPSKFPASKYPVGSLPLIIFKEHLKSVPGYCPEIDYYQYTTAFVICGCDTCTFTMYIPHTASSIYLDSIKGMKRQRVTVGHEAIALPPFPQRASASHVERYDPNNPSEVAITNMMEFLPDCIALSILHHDHFIEDEILHAGRHIYDKKSVPLWASFAFSVQLDIAEIGSMFTSNPFDNLKAAVEKAKAEHNINKSYAEKIANTNVWPKDRVDLYGSTVHEFTEWVLTNKFGKVTGRKRRQQLLTDFPLTCATMKMQLSLELNLAGKDLVNGSGCIMMMAHLYNAARVHDPKLKQWPDMELFIATQGPEHIFVGERPSTMIQAEMKLNLACGVSIASYAKNSRTRRRHPTSKYRQMEIAPLAMNFMERLLGHGTRQVDECAYELQELIFSDKHIKTANRLMWENPNSPTSYDARKGRSRSSDASFAQCVLDTLHKLSKSFIAEGPALTLDYFSLHKRCWELFRQINRNYSKMEESDSIWLSHPMSQADDWCPSITLKIISVATNSVDFTKFLRGHANKKLDRTGGAALAETFLSLQSQDSTPEMTEVASTMAKRIKQEGLAEVAAGLLATDQDQTESILFTPVIQAFESMYSKSGGDAEIEKLSNTFRKTSYCKYLFSDRALESLYGPHREQEWQDIRFSQAFNADDNSGETTEAGDAFSRTGALQLICYQALRLMAAKSGYLPSAKREKIKPMTAEQLAEMTKAMQKAAIKDREAKNNAVKDEDDHGLGSWFG